MKKTPVYLVLITCTILVCIVIVAFLFNNKSTLNQPQENQTKQVIDSGYLIKEYDGKIATFKPKSDTPIEVFDVYTSTLPESEITQLKKGIYAKDKKELQQLIEAYTS